jgi:hypothetical protein
MAQAEQRPLIFLLELPWTPVAMYMWQTAFLAEYAKSPRLAW